MSISGEEQPQMPGREAPKSTSSTNSSTNGVINNYPPCNRAFALRMMNPTSYSDERISPLDKEIQPLAGKKFVAKQVFSSGIYQQNSTDVLSVDEISLSPASSCASLSELDLYDIDENRNTSISSTDGGKMFPRQRSSLEAHYMRNSKPTKSSSSSNEGEYGMRRSYSSAGGFDGGFFQRGHANRSSTPSRARSKSKNGFKEEASTYLQTHQSSSSPKGARLGNTPGVRRTQSLKGGRPNVSVNPIGRTKSTVGTPQKSPNSKIRVVGTKSSQLRAQSAETKQTPGATKAATSSPTNQRSVKSTVNQRGRTTSRSHKTRSLNSTEEYSESDSSVFSEVSDSYYPRRSRQGSVKLNGHSSPSARRAQANRGSPSSSPAATSKNFLINDSLQMKRLPKVDTFSGKLTDVCRLISERYPGDFQILETLTEMQSAYEERNHLVTETISGLREKTRLLEHKCANSPNIPGLVIPLMRATNAFQSQLQCIMDAYHQPGIDETTQFPESGNIIRKSEPNAQDTVHNGSLDQISKEANLVASRIEKLGGLGSSSQSPVASGYHGPKQETLHEDHILETSGGSSDKENHCDGAPKENGDVGGLCNGYEREHSSLESYAIINEAPSAVTYI
uniref:Uncharacterized protein n=1 Tax=Clytia hemisphaerica TaxID=252671 RepID=A0A7M5XLV3_9CNID